jgi:hypothetical protein
MKFIPLDAVLAEIERRIKILQKNPFENHKTICHLDSLKQSYNTLEVKDISLEKEIECSLPKPAWGWNEDYLGKSNPAYSMEQVKEFAKHFFELGVRKKKGEKYEVPSVSKTEDVSVTSRMAMIDDDLKPIAEFILDYAGWNLHKDEWNHPVLEVPLFRVLDALIQRGKPYCGKN